MELIEIQKCLNNFKKVNANKNEHESKWKTISESKIILNRNTGSGCMLHDTSVTSWSSKSEKKKKNK